MGMTIVEKILARASGRPKVSPGDFVVVTADTIIFTDFAFKPTAREILKVHDPDRIVVVFDHNAPASDRMSAAAHVDGRDFVKRVGVTRFHDVGPNQGISHVVVVDEVYALPGTVAVCSDSHTCALGVLNCAARGVGAPELIYAATTGQTWFCVGETIRYDLVGALPVGVSTKDLFLYIAGHYGDHTNQNVEFGGPGPANLNLNARRSLTTMGAELSAEFVTFEPDEILLAHVRAHATKSFEPQNADPDAEYAARHTIDLASIEPLVALPDAVIRNSVEISKVAGQPIEQAFIGSCANGTLDDFEEAARIVRGKRIARGVRFLVTPGSSAVLKAARAAGYVQILEEAGAIVTPSSCGACFGGHLGVLGPGETCITASTRNFKGRMGHPSARIFMASSATVAASAIAGCIAHPAAIAGA